MVFVSSCRSQQSDNVQWFVGQVLEIDSIYNFQNISYAGITYYYGVHHLMILTQNSDTMYLANVYNIKSDNEAYANGFGINLDSTYIFTVHRFAPCDSDFPQIQGRCDEGTFFPINDKLISSYKYIYRLINFVPYRDPKSINQK